MNEFHYDLFMQAHEINRFRFIFQNLRQYDLDHKYEHEHGHKDHVHEQDEHKEHHQHDGHGLH